MLIYYIMSASNTIGDFDLNVVKMRKPIEFSDGSIQSTAFTNPLVYNDTNLVNYTLTTNFSVNYLTLSLDPGVYLLSQNLTLTNQGLATVTWDYLTSTVSQTTGQVLSQDFTQNFSLASGDNTWRNVNIVFNIPVTQSVNFSLVSKSGAFSGNAPVLAKRNATIIKLADL